MNFWQRLSKIEDYIHKYWIYVASPFVIGFVVSTMYDSIEDKEELEANYKSTMGKVYASSRIPGKSKMIHYYEFSLNGKKYKGSSTGYFSDNVHVGDYFLVEYSGINAANNRMNFDSAYFVYYDKDSTGNINDTNYLKWY